jgi:hypothetical protein
LVASSYAKSKKIGSKNPFSKLLRVMEEQGVDGAQQLSVSSILDDASTGATRLFAASGNFENRF